MHSWEDLEIFKLAIENASDHIIVTDPKAKIIYANKAVEHITGYLPKEIIGKTPKLWGGLMPPAYYSKFWKVVKEDRKSFVGEIRNRRKSGEIYYAEIKVAPVLNRAGNVKYFVGIERDITRLKKIDQIKTDIISLTAHQLKNAPSVIKLYADSLLDDVAGKLNKKQTVYIKEIRHANKDNIDLINALLNVTRLELGTFQHTYELIDPKKICKNIIKQFEHLISKNKLTITEHYETGLKPVTIDSEGFKMILQNLLSNACQYTPKGGKITLKLRKDLKRKNKMLLSVTDTGIGIPKAEQSMIFSKLFRTPKAKSATPDGTGLGLYMTKLILKKLGGSITFESAEDKGTTFNVSFPLKK